MSFRICFVTDGEPFHGASPEERALGGSETALIQVARALARRGNTVEVFCQCPAPGSYHGVIYNDISRLAQLTLERKWDVLIVSRFFDVLKLPLQAGLNVLWNHDILDRPGRLVAYLDSIDLMFVLSQFHAADYAKKLPACTESLVLTRNGLDIGQIRRATANVDKVPGRLVYASRPERGLKLLLQYIWPRLLQQFPHLSLTICGYDVHNTPIHPSIQREYDEIAELARVSPRLEMVGALAKAAYYRHLASCELMLYPCVFPEISCLAALEAQAVGTPVVTSDSFALAETVVPQQCKVGGEPGSPAYIEKFIQASSLLISNKHIASEVAEQARSIVLKRNCWDEIAAQWEREFTHAFEARARGKLVSLAARQVLNGDRLAAADLLGRRLPLPHEPPSPPDPMENQLITAMVQMISSIARPHTPHDIGVVCDDNGRTVLALASALPAAKVTDLGANLGSGAHDLLVVRDALECAEDPALTLEQLLKLCAEHGHVLLCVASGAWPLLSPGHAARTFDLDGHDLSRLLSGRELRLRFVPQGLIKAGASTFSVGRWLALAPSVGPTPQKISIKNRWLSARPAPPEVEAEVLRAGLI